MVTKKELIFPTKEELLSSLKERFNTFTYRHPDVSWNEISAKISNNSALFNSLAYLEATDGKPDLISLDSQLYFVDLSKESPKRRSICYDKEARVNRKKNPPASSVLEICYKWNLELLSPEDYHYLQEIEPLDQKTSSWLLTPDNIRTLGGALFGDRRYDTTFIYHNGADCYYASRGFRAKIKL